MDNVAEEKALTWKVTELVEMLKRCNEEDVEKVEEIIRELARAFVKAGWTYERYMEFMADVWPG